MEISAIDTSTIFVLTQSIVLESFYDFSFLDIRDLSLFYSFLTITLQLVNEKALN